MTRECIVVLLVDDSADSKDVIRDFLKSETDIPLNFVDSSNGREALRKLEQHKVDIIICDEVMPQMSGSVFIQQARARGTTCPIVLISGLERRHLESVCDVDSTIEILTKPFDYRELQATVLRLTKAAA